MEEFAYLSPWNWEHLSEHSVTLVFVFPTLAAEMKLKDRINGHLHKINNTSKKKKKEKTPFQMQGVSEIAVPENILINTYNWIQIFRKLSPA